MYPIKVLELEERVRAEQSKAPQESDLHCHRDRS
ncbi:hypothetical protein WH7805_04056 [Synechococcus sp. WH 7805]|nr:hypothetical protein WH7805_04056 [Synechococcus sp. WH 7805]